MHIFLKLPVNFELIKIQDNFDERVKRTDTKVIDAIQLIRLSEALTEIYVHMQNFLLRVAVKEDAYIPLKKRAVLFRKRHFLTYFVS